MVCSQQRDGQCLLKPPPTLPSPVVSALAAGVLCFSRYILSILCLVAFSRVVSRVRWVGSPAFTPAASREQTVRLLWAPSLALGRRPPHIQRSHTLAVLERERSTTGVGSTWVAARPRWRWLQTLPRPHPTPRPFFPRRPRPLHSPLRLGLIWSLSPSTPRFLTLSMTFQSLGSTTCTGALPTSRQWPKVRHRRWRGQLRSSQAATRCKLRVPRTARLRRRPDAVSCHRSG